MMEELPKGQVAFKPVAFDWMMSWSRGLPRGWRRDAVMDVWWSIALSLEYDTGRVTALAERLSDRCGGLSPKRVAYAVDALAELGFVRREGDDLFANPHVVWNGTWAAQRRVAHRWLPPVLPEAS